MRLLGAPVAYIRYLHLQLFLKYSPKGSGDALASRVGKLRDAYCRDLARAMFAVGLADNGSEFSRADDVTLILFGEGAG